MGLTFRSGRVAEVVLGRGGGRHKCWSLQVGVLFVLLWRQKGGRGRVDFWVDPVFINKTFLGFGNGWARVGFGSLV